MVTPITTELFRSTFEERALRQSQVRLAQARLHEAQRLRVRESLLLRPEPSADRR
jgi:hypothetical protein